jgi:TorA maturation chaperone TorD
MTTPSTDLATVVVPHAHELVSRHVDRSRQYRMTAKLLSSPPGEAMLAGLRSLVQHHTSPIGHDRALRLLREALTNAWAADVAEEFGDLFLAPQPAVELRCDTPTSWVLALACATTNVPQSALRTTELEALAVLSEQTAWALGSADRTPAGASTMDLQRRLIEQHSRSCLGRLARDLERSRGSFYGSLGLALRWRLEDDSRMLAMDAT